MVWCGVVWCTSRCFDVKALDAATLRITTLNATTLKVTTLHGTTLHATVTTFEDISWHGMASQRTSPKHQHSLIGLGSGLVLWMLALLVPAELTGTTYSGKWLTCTVYDSKATTISVNG